MIYIILALILIIFFIKYKQVKQENKQLHNENTQLNNNNKLKKLYENNNISDVNTVIEKLDKGKF